MLPQLRQLIRSDRSSVGWHLVVAGLCFVGGVIVVGAVAGASILLISDSNRDVTHRLDELELRHLELLQTLTNGEAALRGYALTLDEEFREPLDLAQATYPDLVADTFRMAGDDHDLRLQLEHEVAAADAWLNVYAVVAETIVSSGVTPDNYVDEQQRGKDLFDALRVEHARTRDLIEARKAEALDRVRWTTWGGALVTAITTGAVLVVGAVVARRARKAIVTPLERLADGITSLEGGDLTTRITPEGPREVRSVAVATNQFANFLEQGAAMQRTRAESDRLVREVASRMYKDADVPLLLSASVATLGPAFGCDQVLVLAVDDASRPGVILAEWIAERSRAFGLDTQLAFPESFIELVQTGVFRDGTWTVENIEDDERIPEDSKIFLREHNVEAILVAPVTVANEVRAVLSLHAERERTWSDTDRWMARSLATELGSAMRLGEQFEHERAMVRELQQLDAAKSDFISSVSHELRTPLTSILGYTELLLDGDAGALTTQQHEMLAIVDRNARRLLLLIDDLLTMSRIEANRLTITPTEMPAGRLIEGVAEAIRPLSGAAGQQLVVDVPDTSLTIWADERALERALLNLASNAVKFTPAGGTITLAAERQADGVDLRVSDTGVGIPEDEQSQLFTRFFRSSTSRELAIQGTGLGLAIVRHIVEAHGGTIDVRSKPGAGTSVTLRMAGGPTI